MKTGITRRINTYNMVISTKFIVKRNPATDIKYKYKNMYEHKRLLSQSSASLQRLYSE